VSLRGPVECCAFARLAVRCASDVLEVDDSLPAVAVLFEGLEEGKPALRACFRAACSAARRMLRGDI